MSGCPSWDTHLRPTISKEHSFAMSHFTITVALPGDTPAELEQLQKALEAALAPFDENLTVDRYLEYTREQLIANGREEIERYRTGLYAKYLADPEAYREQYKRNPAHLTYIAEEFPKRLTWTDEQVYASQVSWYDPSEIGPDGEVYSERNPQSKWDWWVVGGRWGGMWRFKEPVDYPHLGTEASTFGMNEDAAKALATDCGRVSDIAPETFDSTWGYIDLEGQWHEKGQMGWFGLSDADETDNGEKRWKKQYLDWIASLPKDAWVVNIDCHI